MAFFREYLKKSKILHDPRFDETDEDFLVQALLQARMNQSKGNIVIKTGFFGQRDLERELKTPKAQDASDLKSLAEHAKSVNIVMELGLQGEEIQYINDAIMEVTGCV